ncbi:MAG: 4Fe-4S cluster-binding domain-containing protein [archaeon]|nr:4Fe-4S cluster-binding domain-containing protein [archaeon]MCP8314139.1 4Fe-4S cluster-binding domain-containing protein [archaeon]
MVYFDLQRSYGSAKRNYDKTMAIQKCGNFPYEISLRFAGCNLRCGLCFASGYSWPDKFLKKKTVTNEKTVDDVVEDFKAIPYPSGYDHYNWLRVLGGEPLLSDKYVDFLFEVLIKISEIDSKKFNNGIIIQTNGIYVGKGNTTKIKKYLEELYEINSSVKVAIETSIKGTNPEEFKILTQQSSDELFKYNLKSYFALKQLKLPNLRSMVVAGFGVNESFLLRECESKERMTIVFKDNKPCYHPDFWTNEFQELYDDFTKEYQKLHPMFAKMPMYGIKDRFDLGWVKRALKQGKQIYGERFYDSKYSAQKNTELENSFFDILGKFFLVDNQRYYSAMIKQ